MANILLRVFFHACFCKILLLNCPTGEGACTATEETTSNSLSADTEMVLLVGNPLELIFTDADLIRDIKHLPLNADFF